MTTSAGNGLAVVSNGGERHLPALDPESISENRFDVVLLLQTIEHVKDDRGLLLELSRVLQLSNPDWLEWVLGVRGRWRSRTASPSGTLDMLPPSPGVDSAPRTGVRRHWRDDVLPWIREHSPGWKFQVLACSAEPAQNPH